MKKLFINLIIILSFANVCLASDLSKFANDVWNDMKNSSQSIGGTTLNSQGGSYYSGGGYSYTAPSSTFQPFSVRAPSVKAGCTGISIDAGAFNYSGEEMINFLKSIISGAPGYAFNLAMQILCPSCTDLMNTINDISAMINAMQMDSCAALDMIGVATEAKAAAATAKTDYEAGKSNSWNKAIKKTSDKASEVVKKFASSLNCIGNDDCPDKFLKGEETLLEFVARKANVKTIADKDTIDMFRAFIGDIEMNEKENSLIPTFKTPAHTYGPGYKGMLQLLIDNKGVGDKKTTNDITVIRVKNGSYSIEKPVMKTYHSLAEENLNEIENAFIGRNSLSTTNLKFLAMFKSPVYKILNNTSISNESLKSFISKFKILAATQLMYEVISNTTLQINLGISEAETALRSVKILGSDSTDGATVYRDIEDMKNYLRTINETAFALYVEKYAEFDKSMKEIDNLNKMTNNMQALMARHPVMGSAFFGRGVGK